MTSLLVAVGGVAVAAVLSWWAIRSGERRGNAERRARVAEGKRAGANLAYGCAFAIGSVVLVLVLLLAIVVGLIGG